jgi:hypothetical protein
MVSQLQWAGAELCRLPLHLARSQRGLVCKACWDFFSGITALTALFTLMIPETKGRSLEDIEAERLYGARVSAASSMSKAQSVAVVSKLEKAEA